MRGDHRPIVEIPAIAGIEIRLGRHSLRQHHIMLRQFDMPVGHVPTRLPHDTIAIHQQTRGDEHIVEI